MKTIGTVKQYLKVKKEIIEPLLKLREMVLSGNFSIEKYWELANTVSDSLEPIVSELEKINSTPELCEIEKSFFASENDFPELFIEMDFDTNENHMSNYQKKIFDFNYLVENAGSLVNAYYFFVKQ